MNVSCPKCGFEQPSDRFCANCGIDMENYRAPVKPLVQRLLGSSMFYGLLALLMIGGAIYLVTRTASRKFPDTIPAPGFTVNQQPMANQAAATTPPTGETLPVSGQAGLDATPLPQAPSAFVTPAPNPLKGKAPDSADTASRGRKHSVKITWAEVNKDYFIELFGETLPYGVFRAGILMEEFNNRSLKARMDLGRSEKMIRILDTSTHPVNVASETERRIEIKLRSHDPKMNEKIGVVLNLDPVHVDESGLQLRFEVKRAIPQLSGQRYTLDTFNASDEILIPPRGAAFISGFLPHREPYDESEQKLFDGNSALKVLNLKTFQASQSEIVVFIENTPGD
ncbi:MAG: hypothetical protein ABL958_00960 [Bdellovibrionia bacterium]